MPQRSSQTRKSIGKETVSPPAVSPGELEVSILEVMKKHAAKKGLTYSELLKKCGARLKRSLAALFNRKEPRSEDVKGLLYDLWGRGLLFFEPPNRGQRVGRVWDMESARNVFPLACPFAPERDSSKQTTEVSQEALKAAYSEFVPEHLGGFVPIFKVRRALGWSSQAFDSLLWDLNERHDPVVELHGGDPADLTEGEKRDSLWKDSRLLIRMRWRVP
ncbi:MAG: hypothetical protein WBG50_20690 [Desulfomonilaceae bacterium]